MPGIYLAMSEDKAGKATRMVTVLMSGKSCWNLTFNTSNLTHCLLYDLEGISNDDRLNSVTKMLSNLYICQFSYHVWSR